MMYLSSDFEKISTNRGENVSYFKSVQLLYLWTAYESSWPAVNLGGILWTKHLVYFVLF